MSETVPRRATCARTGLDSSERDGKKRPSRGRLAKGRNRSNGKGMGGGRVHPSYIVKRIRRVPNHITASKMNREGEVKGKKGPRRPKKNDRTSLNADCPFWKKWTQVVVTNPAKLINSEKRIKNSRHDKACNTKRILMLLFQRTHPKNPQKKFSRSKLTMALSHETEQ